MEKEVPEGERNGNVKNMTAYIVDIAQGGWSFRQAQKNLGELSTFSKHLGKVESMLADISKDSKEAILQVLDYQKKNCTQGMIEYCFDNQGFSLIELYEDVAQDKITKLEDTKKRILDSMTSFNQEQSNKMIADMVKGSAIVAVCQLVKIYCAWKKISAASNVIKDPNAFTMINKNIEKMERMVTEFLDLCEGSPNDNSVISRKMMRINTLFTSTLGKISTLKVTINGHIQCLDLQADYSAVDGVVNIATAGTQGYQLWHTWSDLTSATKVIGVASVAVFMGLAFANYKTYQLSQETLKELRKKFNEATRLQDMLQDLHDQAAGAVNEMQ